MVNMAEKVHRVRRRRQYLNDSSTHATRRTRRMLHAKLQSRSATRSAAGDGELLGHLSIEPVFTAHPTESTRRTLLRQQQRIASLLIDAARSVADAGGEPSLDDRTRAHGTHHGLADRRELARPL